MPLDDLTHDQARLGSPEPSVGVGYLIAWARAAERPYSQSGIPLGWVPIAVVYSLPGRTRRTGWLATGDLTRAMATMAAERRALVVAVMWYGGERGIKLGDDLRQNPLVECWRIDRGNLGGCCPDEQCQGLCADLPGTQDRPRLLLTLPALESAAPLPPAFRLTRST